MTVHKTAPLFIPQEALRAYKQNCTAALDYADLAREIIEKVSTADTREE